LRTIRSTRAMRRASEEARRCGGTMGFVPTMGYLHEGHLSLLDKAERETDVAVVSIFVNPLQFGPREDLRRYPRDFSRDRALARNRGCDIMFCPSQEGMYQPGFSTSVRVKGLETKLCGRFRPGHFEGVCTVVMKLINIVQPHRLYLGQKDAQQAIIIERMIEDMGLDVAVRICPIVREADGLAMSSRNVYLTAAERAQAPVIHQALKAGAAAIAGGERKPARVKASMKRVLKTSSLARVEYLEIVDRADLETPKRLKGPTLLAAAVWFGRTRLIDNVLVNV